MLLRCAELELFDPVELPREWRGTMSLAAPLTAGASRDLARCLSIVPSQRRGNTAGVSPDAFGPRACCARGRLFRLRPQGGAPTTRSPGRGSTLESRVLLPILARLRALLAEVHEAAPTLERLLAPTPDTTVSTVALEMPPAAQSFARLAFALRGVARRSAQVPSSLLRAFRDGGRGKQRASNRVLRGHSASTEGSGDADRKLETKQPRNVRSFCAVALGARSTASGASHSVNCRSCSRVRVGSRLCYRTETATRTDRT
uniref:Uncharacterized protein n=1 Tax=Toxoplasma gondii (strain ATCC 50861 / VEG) TaxID=432359 RepID=A0A0F7V7N3_TOXGV|nr:TPA: hypothetical protein BN1205_002440 [Toxoplasma gondii VEG]